MKKVFVLIFLSSLIFNCCLPARGNTYFFSADHKPLHKTPVSFSSPGDYFRSAATGDWNLITTWESSPDGSSWAAATLTPTIAAATITIRSTHTVTVNSNEDMDEVVIQSGGILLHASGTLTVNNGSGDDINVQGGGIFTLANSTGPVFLSGATAFIGPNGMLRVSAGGLTGAGTGVNASNFVYSDASVLEYALAGAFSADGVTYFPNVNASTIPIFRTTSNAGSVGGTGNLTINGLYEANGNVTFQNAGFKIFRNGITGTGNISSVAGSGKFAINGLTANLGGTGSLTLPTAGMDIGTTTTVTMVSDKAVNGTISLLSNALVMLGVYNLTMTGSISGGSATSHIVTNSSGKLVMNNVQAFPLFSVFPIGGNTTTYNPVAIANGDGLNFGARVEIGINPSIRFPVAAINRTWVVRSSGTPVSTVNVNFIYSTGHGNASFNYATTVEQGFYTSVWNVINSGLVQAGGPPTYQVATTVSIFQGNADAPMVLGNIPAILESGNSIQLTAQKQNEKVMMNWSVMNPSLVDRFVAERAADGRTYSSLAELPSAGLSFTDLQPMPGLNYYRIKMAGKDGRISYSNVVAILNAAKGFDLISVAPNPVVNGIFTLNVSTAQKTQMKIAVTDMQGRLVQIQTVNMNAGFNSLPMNVADLGPGTYQLYGTTVDGRSRVLRFVVQ